MGQQLVLLLTSKGVAGVPRGALVILLGTVSSFGLPVEPVFIILGIDELMDMLRTSVNVLGNCLATVVIARREGGRIQALACGHHATRLGSTARIDRTTRSAR
jgi:proton glutamate symport protein